MSELCEEKRKLQFTADKREQQIKELEEKNKKLKEYKNMVNNSCALQCSHCSKFVSSNIFQNHINSCLLNQSKMSSASISVPLPQSSFQNSQLPNNFLNIDLSHLIISINQTMVRESPDNKPYTEYLIEMIFEGSNRWEVARKYKNFCELHQQLMNAFPGLRFPESSQAIINFSSDINNVFQNKRPTVIEDRRKALQQYLRDLVQIDLVRNSKPYKNFLEIDKHLEVKYLNQITHHTKQTLQQSHPMFSAPLKSDQNEYNAQNNYPDSYLTHTQQSHYSANGDNIIYQPQQLPTKKIALPQSPSSFLKSWNEKNINKENNPRTSAQPSQSLQLFNTPPQ